MFNPREFFKPNGLKIVLTLVLIIPSLVALFIVTAFIAQWWRWLGQNVLSSLGIILFGLLLSVLLSYYLGCLLDTLIKLRSVKVGVAVLLGVVSAVIGFFAYYAFFGIRVCDPVHEPNQCELACRTIIENVTSQAPEIMQKFDECISNCYK
jgi:predicted neutral ceramidase superfamily lipid hydrolase